MLPTGPSRHHWHSWRRRGCVRWCHSCLRISPHRPARIKPSHVCAASPPRSTCCGRCWPRSWAPCRHGVSGHGPCCSGSRIAQRPPGANGYGPGIPGGAGASAPWWPRRGWSTRRQPGGTGDDWRLPLGDDFTAGRLAQVRVTDRYGGEKLVPVALQPGDIAVADHGDGDRLSVASATRQQADVVLRVTPATCPRATAAGEAFEVVPWRRTPGHAGMAWVVCLGAPALCRPAAGGSAPARRRGHRPATGAAQGPKEGADAERDGFTPGGLGATRHDTGSHRVAAGRRPALVSGALARGTGVETDETVAPAPSHPAYTPHQWGSSCTGVAHGVGLASRGDGHDPGSPAHRHAQGSSAGQELVADWRRPRYPAAARLWHVVAGAGADRLAPLASRCGAQPAPPRASGNDHPGLAHRSRARLARHRARGGMKGAR